MRSQLVAILNGLIILATVGLVVGSALFGHSQHYMIGVSDIEGLIIGALVGIALSGLSFGVIAAILDIRDQMVQAAGALQRIEQMMQENVAEN